MAKDMNKELLEVIRQNLSEAQVGLIKDALNERDILRKNVKELEADVKDVDLRLKNTTLENRQYGKDLAEKDETITSLLEKVSKLQDENLDLRDKDVERRAALAEGKLDAVWKTQELFLKNTIVRENIQTHVVDEGTSISNQYNNGQTIPVPMPWKTNKPVTNINEVTTTTEDNTKEVSHA